MEEASGSCCVTQLAADLIGLLLISSSPVFKSRLSTWVREINPVGECQHLIRCASRVMCLQVVLEMFRVPLRRLLRSEGGTRLWRDGEGVGVEGIKWSFC